MKNLGSKSTDTAFISQQSKFKGSATKGWSFPPLPARVSRGIITVIFILAGLAFDVVALVATNDKES